MSKNIRILVVDDDETLRLTIATSLKSKFTVMTAASGIEARAMVKTNDIDIVLSDVCMPNGSGVELLEWLRQDGETMPVVVLVTGYAQITEDDAKFKGAHAILNKPCTRKILLQTIDEIVQSRSSNEVLAA